jgi:transcriptional regulator with XRE-family HTH domain
MNTKKIIGEFVSNLRKKKKMTQVELADLCKSSSPTIINLENGNANYTIDLLLKISEVLGFSLVFKPKPTTEQESRFLLQKSEKENFWILTDTKNQIVCKFENKKFNQTQEFFYSGSKKFEVSQITKIMREFGEFLFENYPELN